MLKVGIIDSGIHRLPSERILEECCFSYRDGAVITGKGDAPDRLGHGSALARIITERAPQTKLLVAKVFFEKLTCTPAQIAAALDWQIAQGAQIVNMSFGLHADRPQLREACNRALSAGLVLVAASPARGNPVFPAAYPGVIRATGDARCGPEEISYLNSPQADFGAYVRDDTATTESIAGASVGCAYITAAFANILQQQASLNPTEVIEQLISTASYIGPENRGLAGDNDQPSPFSGARSDEFSKKTLSAVIPAQAGIHNTLKDMDSHLRGSDEIGIDRSFCKLNPITSKI